MARRVLRHPEQSPHRQRSSRARNRRAPPQWTFLAEHRRDPLAQLINALSDPIILIALTALGAVLITYEVLAAGLQGACVLGGVLIALALYLLGQLGAE
jgi:membrane-bound serine protease (ClpP class)